MAQELPPERQARIRAIAISSGLGCSVVASLVIMIGGGVLLDQRLDTLPVFTLAGVVLGLIAASYELVLLVRATSRRRRDGGSR